MFDILLYLLLIFILLLFLSSSFRAWIVARLLSSIQKRLFNKMMQEQAKRNAYTQKEQNRKDKYGAQNSDRETRAYQGKMDMDDIATKKFEKSQSEDYVDFEELPKK